MCRFRSKFHVNCGKAAMGLEDHNSGGCRVPMSARLIVRLVRLQSRSDQDLVLPPDRLDQPEWHFFTNLEAFVLRRGSWLLSVPL